MANVLLLASAALLSGCAAVAGGEARPTPDAAAQAHYWLHPRLGMVQVDAVTHAIVVPGRAAPQPVSAPQR